jgi:hypothetical protein
LILALSLLAFASLTVTARAGGHHSPAPRAGSAVAAAMLP